MPVTMFWLPLVLALLVHYSAAAPTKQSLIELTSYSDYKPLIESLEQVFRYDIPVADTYTITEEDSLRLAELEFPIAMSPVEVSYFENKIKQSRIYFEFGAGGSTKLACHTNENMTIFSVDSNLDFLLQIMNNDSCVRDRYGDGKLFMYIADIGEVREWGYPIYNHTKAFEDYSLSIVKGYSGNPSDIDLVLVDGRFRVACILQTLLVTARDTVILVHDFIYRPEYFIVLLFVDIVDRVDTLVALKRKRSLNYHDYVLMREHLEYFRTVPG